MIRVCETGRNPTMRYLHRTHRVFVGWLHERFADPTLDLSYEITTRMSADIYTEAFTDASKWEHAQWLINVEDPSVLRGRIRRAEEETAREDAARTPPQSGGSSRPRTPPEGDPDTPEAAMNVSPSWK